MASAAPRNPSVPPDAGDGEAAHVAFVVAVPVPVHSLPLHDALPDAVAEMVIFVVRTAFNASTHWVTLPPTST